MKHILKAVVLALAALALSSAPAYATPQQDQKFNQMLLAGGIEPGIRAVEAARAVCDYLWIYDKDAEDVVGIVDSDNPGLDRHLSRVFVAVSVIVYCPPPQLRDV